MSIQFFLLDEKRTCIYPLIVITMPPKRLGSHRLYLLLHDLQRALGATEFGRVSQILLCEAFRNLHFNVLICQLSGRPDIRAQKGREKYEIEVKTSLNENILIKLSDLKGVQASGYRRIIAVLTYPATDPKWLVLDADKLEPGRYAKATFSESSLYKLDSRINRSFVEVVHQHYESAVEGSSKLRNALVKS